MGVLSRIAERVTGGWKIYAALCFAGLLIGVCIGAFGFPDAGIQPPDPALSEILKKARLMNYKIRNGVSLLELESFREDFEFSVLEWERSGAGAKYVRVHDSLNEVITWQSRLCGFWETSIKHDVIPARIIRESATMEYLVQPANSGVISEWKNGVELIDTSKLRSWLIERLGESLDRLEADAAKIGE